MAKFFIRPSMKVYKNVTADRLNTTTPIYANTNFIVNELFFRRLEKVVQMIPKDKHGGKVLDLGCGEGVLLPTLNRMFSEVDGLDLKVDISRFLVEAENLQNVHLIEGDMTAFTGSRKYDVIVATDVLEHILDMDIPVRFVDENLANDGSFFVSLPTENIFYQMGRTVFRIMPPPDHYHKPNEIIQHFCANGYQCTQHYRYPLQVPSWLTVFDICEFKRVSGEKTKYK